MYGFYMAAEVAYFTYIYAKVDKVHFQQVTGQVRSAHLLGKALSGITAQVGVYYAIISYKQLLWISVLSRYIHHTFDGYID